MAQLAAMLGEPERVHFTRLDPGSTVIVHETEPGAYELVRGRVQEIELADAPKDALAAFREIDALLSEDNATGELITPDNVIRFRGITRPKPIVYGGFNQRGSLDGVLVRVGGRGETVPVHIQSEQGAEPFVCQAGRDIARRIAPHIFEDVLRVHGEGRWHRDGDGTWKLERFTIHDFEVLDDTPLPDMLARLRAAPGNGWEAFDDPLGELARLRGEEEHH
jgi:hypothetical protein